MKSVSSIPREVLRKAIEHVVADVTLCSRHLQAKFTRQTLHVWIWNRNSLAFASLWMLLATFMMFFFAFWNFWCGFMLFWFCFLAHGASKSGRFTGQAGSKDDREDLQAMDNKNSTVFPSFHILISKKCLTIKCAQSISKFWIPFFRCVFCLPKICLCPLPTWGWKLLAAARPSWERLNGSARKLAWAIYLDGREDGVMACWDD